MVDVKFQDGVTLRMTGSADFVAAVTTAILKVTKKSIKQVSEGEPELEQNMTENRFKGLPPMFSPE